MRLIFFDTEFTELGIDPRLISIGLIDELGEKAFYAELSDTWEDKHASDFARLAVLPLLGDKSMRVSIAELSHKLEAWLSSFGEPVQLATDSVSWDWMWIPEIFDVPNGAAWSSNLERHPYPLRLTQEFQIAVEDAFATGLRRHHALDDAKANRLAWLSLGGLY